MKSVTISPEDQEAGPCSHPDPTAEACCKLDCLVRPRFFCGQLLTDRDLTDLERWIQDKLRLARYRDGWGVVCGLDVHCDPAQYGRVIVEPGYAVSPCGNDIIVCKPTGYDMSAVCRRDKDPCEEWAAKPAEEPALQEFVLYIYYKEVEGDLQTALGRSACGQTAKCEASRVHEGFQLHTWERGKAVKRPTPATSADCRQVVDAFDAWQQANPRAAWAQVQRWFLEWIAEHPPHHFCFVRDWLCQVEPGQGKYDKVPNEATDWVKFWLVQGRRNALLACHCPEGEELPGVPLARIWLRRARRDGKQICVVEGIDPYPPYRRPLGRDCQPGTSGAIDLRRWVWHPVDEVLAALCQLGIQATEYPIQFDQMKPWLDDLSCSCGDQVQVASVNADEVLALGGMDWLEEWFKLKPFGERVVGFRCTRQAPEKGSKAVPAEKPPEAPPPAPAKTARKRSG